MTRGGLDKAVRGIVHSVVFAGYNKSRKGKQCRQVLWQFRHYNICFPGHKIQITNYMAVIKHSNSCLSVGM